ncbi:MAG: peptidoglycan editing factor PgeF [Cellulosilyticaceae bacterium]
MCKKSESIKYDKKIPYVVFPQWEKEAGMAHCFTTKLGGVSEDEWYALNLGFNRGDAHENVVANYEKVCELLEVPLASLVLSRQVHEDKIAYVGEEACGNGILYPNKWESMDGIYTDQKNVTLVTHYADCVPLFFYARDYGMIGVAHAGWRGTVSEIGVKMIEKWHKTHHIPLEAIEVGIGPSIGPCCFEVHNDVADVFLQKFGHTDFIVENDLNGKYNINLWECNKQSMVRAGLKENQIVCLELCTCCEHDVFYSHRHTQGKRGTLGAFMVLK